MAGDQKAGTLTTRPPHLLNNRNWYNRTVFLQDVSCECPSGYTGPLCEEEVAACGGQFTNVPPEEGATYGHQLTCDFIIGVEEGKVTLTRLKHPSSSRYLQIIPRKPPFLLRICRLPQVRCGGGDSHFCHSPSLSLIYSSALGAHLIILIQIKAD